jgi:hypothetical protein
MNTLQVVIREWETVAGMPNSGPAGVTPLTSHTTRDPAGRHLDLKPDHRNLRSAGGSGASPPGSLERYGKAATLTSILN